MHLPRFLEVKPGFRAPATRQNRVEAVKHRLAGGRGNAAPQRGRGLLDYTSEQPLAPGTLIRVPLGKREVPGVVWDAAPSHAVGDAELRAVGSVLDAMPVLDADWRALVDFAAAYYQRGSANWP
jgi:hypothetical protein